VQRSLEQKLQYLVNLSVRYSLCLESDRCCTELRKWGWREGKRGADRKRWSSRGHLYFHQQGPSLEKGIPSHLLATRVRGTRGSPSRTCLPFTP